MGSTAGEGSTGRGWKGGAVVTLDDAIDAVKELMLLQYGVEPVDVTKIIGNGYN